MFSSEASMGEASQYSQDVLSPHLQVVLSTMGSEYSLKQKGSEYFFVKDGLPVSERYHDFSIVGEYVCGTRGAVKFLLNKDGKRISSGYHSFDVQEDGIYGELGADREKVELPTEEAVLHPYTGDRVTEPSESMTAVLERLGNRYSFGQSGGRKVLLKDGFILSEWYHDFSIVGEYVCGQDGAFKYLLKDGKRISSGYHSFDVQEDGIYGELGVHREKVL